MDIEKYAVTCWLVVVGLVLCSRLSGTIDVNKPHLSKRNPDVVGYRGHRIGSKSYCEKRTRQFRGDKIQIIAYVDKLRCKWFDVGRSLRCYFRGLLFTTPRFWIACLIFRWPIIQVTSDSTRREVRRRPSRDRESEAETKHKR